MESSEQLMKQIDQHQQQGYVFWEKGQAESACRIWKQAWELIVKLLQTGQYHAIEDLDRAFHGRQSIASWAGDYGEALRRTGENDLFLRQVGTDFCRQYLDYSSRPNDLNNQNRRRMIAENTFKSGLPEEGDAIFDGFLQDNPRWGWGWASWADQYSFYTQVPWYDLNRAESILRSALKVYDLDNRTEVQDRLRDVLIKMGRPIEASDLETNVKKRHKGRGR